MARHISLQHKIAPATLLNLGTLGFFVAWLAVASYAIAYLISH